MTFAVDVSDADAVEESAATLETTFGPTIDVWVNNAMLSVSAARLTVAAVIDPELMRRRTDEANQSDGRDGSGGHE